ncbi:hypothetical protein DCAR_0417640 [Daucus carota subsp. sativus]|uniref:Uncharacterized protein n=1 Tax=Daucus carota subsp. sativus TaxID=79200 RepID=A0AAF0WZ37_DAUCS|nr:hypothetical protein DCAR_0417640 [Daucus carota subsp. sativus]
MMDASDSFPAADAEKELNPGTNTEVEVDSVSSEIAEKKAVGSSAGKKEKGKNDPMQTFKTTMIVSGVVIVVLAVALAVSKKMKENKA